MGNVEKASTQITSSIRPVVSIQYRCVTDRQTDGRTRGDSIYCIARCGKTVHKIQSKDYYENTQYTLQSYYILKLLIIKTDCVFAVSCLDVNEDSSVIKLLESVSFGNSSFQVERTRYR